MIGQPVPPSVIAAPRELRYVREVAAPPARVYAAFTDPEALAAWWGPNGFRTETFAMDVRPGGQWRFVMRGPDGKEWPNFIEYTEVEPPSRLHWKHRGAEDGPPDFEVELTLTPTASGGTRIGFTMICADEATRDAKMNWGAAEGAQQTLDRLESELYGELRLSRRFDAPRERVWAAWADAAQLARWWGPAAHSLTVESFDFRVGGHFRFRMGDGERAMRAMLDFLEIDAPRRLVYDAAFCDVAGTPQPPPFDGDWPVTIRYEVSFDETDGITTLQLHGTPHAATAAQREFFLASLESMRDGFGAMFDQLQAHLAGRPTCTAGTGG